MDTLQEQFPELLLEILFYVPLLGSSAQVNRVWCQVVRKIPNTTFHFHKGNYLPLYPNTISLIHAGEFDIVLSRGELCDYVLVEDEFRTIIKSHHLKLLEEALEYIEDNTLALLLAWTKIVLKKGISPELMEVWDLISKHVDITREGYSIISATGLECILKELSYYSRYQPSIHLDLIEYQPKTFSNVELRVFLKMRDYKKAARLCSLDPYHPDLQDLLLWYRSPGRKFLKYLEKYITDKESIIHWSIHNGDLESLHYLHHQNKLVKIQTNKDNICTTYLKAHGYLEGSDKMNSRKEHSFRIVYV